jgi:tetratricopeptide repeat protein 8
MMRDAEAQFKSAIKQQPMIATFLQLGKIYLRLDQPLAALEVYRTGLDSFPNEVHLLVGVARIQEGLGNLSLSAKYYKNVLAEDSTHVEAIACIGMNHFYSDQPELSLRFYRRLLQVAFIFQSSIAFLCSRWVLVLLSCTTTLVCATSLPRSTT